MWAENAAVLRYTQFAYTYETTRRRINNTATPKPGSFDEEWAKLDLAPTVLRGKADLQETSLIVMSVKKEIEISAKLLTRTIIAPFGCEEVKITLGEEEDQSAGRLVVPNFQMGGRVKSKDIRVQGGIRSEMTRREKTADRRNPCRRILIRLDKTTIRLRQTVCQAWISISLKILKSG